MNTLSAIPTLSDEQRIAARERARELVVRTAGDAPRREDYIATHDSRYPTWVIRAIAVMLAITAVASALPSLFRLFTAGRDYFLTGINEPIQGAIVGASTFLLAEFLVILSTVSANVLFTGRMRLVFVIPVVMGLSMAIVGNVTIVKPHDVFSWLEALVPVFSVLFISLVAERLVLHSIELRHQSQRAYNDAVIQHQRATSNPDKHADFMRYYANALRAEIFKNAVKGNGATARREQLTTATDADWRYLIGRELAAETWYMQTDDITVTKPTAPTLGGGATNPFGNTVHITQVDDRANTRTTENENANGGVTGGQN